MDVLFYDEDEAEPKRISFSDAMPALEQTEAADQLYEAIRDAELAGKCFWFEVGGGTLESFDAPGFDPYARWSREEYIFRFVWREVAYTFAKIIMALDECRGENDG